MAKGLRHRVRVGLAALLGVVMWVPAWAAPAAQAQDLAEGKYPYFSAFQTAAKPEDLAEGKYPYFSAFPGESPRVTRWAGLAATMPDWKDKNKAAHYWFPLGKEGKQCDQPDCHPGFRDALVDRLAALTAGPERQAAREQRQGLDRCGDCHTYGAIRKKTAACSLHFDQPDRVQCTGCHAQGSKVLIPLGEKKTVALRDHDARAAWPTHQLTKDPKVIACDKACHVPDNPFDVPRACEDCHGKGKLEIKSYTSPSVLLHATDKASLFPVFTSTFFVALTATVLGALFLYILVEIFRARKEANR
jgi:hypothetical protein